MSSLIRPSHLCVLVVQSDMNLVLFGDYGLAYGLVVDAHSREWPSLVVCTEVGAVVAWEHVNYPAVQYAGGHAPQTLYSSVTAIHHTPFRPKEPTPPSPTSHPSSSPLPLPPHTKTRAPRGTPWPVVTSARQ